MSTLKPAVNEFARALVVLAMFVFLLGTPAALATAPPTAVQQASALLSGQSLCGHRQAPLACHAPNGCCRFDHAILPLREIVPEPVHGHIAAVVYANFRDGLAVAGSIIAFRSRAPPV